MRTIVSTQYINGHGTMIVILCVCHIGSKEVRHSAVFLIPRKESALHVLYVTVSPQFQKLALVLPSSLSSLPAHKEERHRFWFTLSNVACSKTTVISRRTPYRRICCSLSRKAECTVKKIGNQAQLIDSLPSLAKLQRKRQGIAEK